jgi:DNA invertase Pin-like site-specific DNA recombinase
MNDDPENDRPPDDRAPAPPASDASPSPESAPASGTPSPGLPPTPASSQSHDLARYLVRRTLAAGPAGSPAAAPDDHTPLGPTTWRAALARNYAAARGRLACSYARKSRDDPDGVSAQHVLNAAKAERDGWFVPDDARFRFSDNDVSGALESRPEFDRMLALARTGAPWSRVYCKNRSRFGRWEDLQLHAFYEVVLRRRGASLHFSAQPREGDDGAATSPTQLMFRSFQDLLDAWGVSVERLQINQKMNGGRRMEVSRGNWPGGDMLPYGIVRTLVDRVTGTTVVAELVPGVPVARRPQDVCRLRYDAVACATVRRIFDEYVAGKSRWGIAAGLTADRVRPPGSRYARRKNAKGPARWTGTHVKDILGQTLYIGHLVWGRNREDGDAPVPIDEADLETGTSALLKYDYMADPPVSEDVWIAAQERRLRDKAANGGKRGRSPDYLLSGLVRCAACGRVFSGQRQEKLPAGEAAPEPGAPTHRYLYYVHSRTYQGAEPSCPFEGHGIRGESLHAFAVEQLRVVLRRDPALAALVRDGLAALRTEAPTRAVEDVAALKAKLDDEVEAHDALKVRVTSASAAAIDSLSECLVLKAESVAALRARIAQAEQLSDRVSRATDRAAAHFARAVPIDCAAAFDLAPPMVRWRIAQLVVLGVTVDPDAGTIQVRFDALVPPDALADAGLAVA